MLYNQHPYSGNQKRKEGKTTKAEELQFSEIQTLYPLDNSISLSPHLLAIILVLSASMSLMILKYRI